MAYKVFTNGSPLPASDLNTYLMNQSVMVFANSTARSAALTSPTEGMVTYTEDNNKVQYYDGAAWQDVTVDTSTLIPKSTVTTTGDLIIANGNASVTRLGIGTNGQYLSSNGTTATWTTPSSGSMTSLASGSISGSQVNLTSISGSYKMLNLRLINFSFANAEDMNLRINGSTTLANYRGIYISTDGGGTQTNIATLDYFYLGTVAAAQNANLDILIKNYAATDTAKLIESNMATNVNKGYAHWGFFHGSGAVTQVTVKTYSGNNFSGGTYELYGVN